MPNWIDLYYICKTRGYNCCKAGHMGCNSFDGESNVKLSGLLESLLVYAACKQQRFCKSLQKFKQTYNCAINTEKIQVLVGVPTRYSVGTILWRLLSLNYDLVSRWTYGIRVLHMPLMYVPSRFASVRIMKVGCYIGTKDSSSKCHKLMEKISTLTNWRFFD